MKWKLIVPAFLLILVTGCSKDKYQTTPQIRIKSLNGNLIPPQGALVITLEVTDKEGDLNSGEITYIPKLLNVRRLAPGIPDYLTITQPIPEFPGTSKVDVDLRLFWKDLHKDINKRQGEDANDTLSFRIALADKAGNKSDTLTTEPIVILGQ